MWIWSGDGSRQDEGRPRVGEEDQWARKLPSPGNPSPPDTSAVSGPGIWLLAFKWTASKTLNMLHSASVLLFHWLNLSQVFPKIKPQVSPETRNRDQAHPCPRNLPEGPEKPELPLCHWSAFPKENHRSSTHRPPPSDQPTQLMGETPPQAHGHTGGGQGL